MIAAQCCGRHIGLCLTGHDNTGTLGVHQHMVDGSDLVVGLLHHCVITGNLVIGTDDTVSVIVVAISIIAEVLRLEKREILDSLCAKGQRGIHDPQSICLGVITGGSSIAAIIPVVRTGLHEGPERLAAVQSRPTDDIQRFQIGGQSGQLGVGILFKVGIGIEGQHIYILGNFFHISSISALVHGLAAVHIHIICDVDVGLQSLCQLTIVVITLVVGVGNFFHFVGVHIPVVGALGFVHNIDTQEGIIIAVGSHIGGQLLRGSNHSMTGHIAIFICLQHIQRAVGDKHTDAVLFGQNKGLLHTVWIAGRICRRISNQIDAAFLNQLEHAIGKGCIGSGAIEAANGHHILATQIVIAQAIRVILGKDFILQGNIFPDLAELNKVCLGNLAVVIDVGSGQSSLHGCAILEKSFQRIAILPNRIAGFKGAAVQVYVTQIVQRNQLAVGDLAVHDPLDHIVVGSG